MNGFILWGAAGLDGLIGDPHQLPHPIRWMGKAIETAEPWWRQRKTSLFRAGAGFAVSLILATWMISAMILAMAGQVSPLAGDLLALLMLYYALSIRSLQAAAMEVSSAINKNDIGAARKKLGFIVSRDTAAMDNDQIARATIETVAENLVDGIISPLFFFLIGGAPLAMTFKMVSTLDSMVGYKTHRYREFGKAAARIDDVANYLPARLSVGLVGIAAFLLGMNAARAVRTALTEANVHASPNAGYPEAAFAGAMGIRLGGKDCYHGKKAEKPFLGKAFSAPQPKDILPACRLMQITALMGVISVWVAGFI